MNELQYERLRRCLTIAVLLFAMLLAPGLAAAAQELVTRNPGQSLEDFAAQFLPPETTLAHQVVEGAFGPGASNVVILYKLSNSENTNYTGLVLVPAPATPNKYCKYSLPPMPEIPGHFEIEVQSVFFARAGRAARELLVLYSYHRNGSEQDDSHGVHAYHWNGKGFVAMEKLDHQLAGLPDAAAVRRKLKSLGY